MSSVLQWETLGYTDKAKANAVSPKTSNQLVIHKMKAHNRSGSAIDVGLLKKLSSNKYDFSLVDSSESPDKVEDAGLEAGTATNIFTTANNDGFLIEADEKFSLIGFNLTQGEAGGPVYTYEYYNGSSYTGLAALDLPSAYSAGEQIIAFLPPSDWVPGSDGTVGGDSNKYSILVRATTAPSQAVIADELWVGAMIDFQESLADNGILEFSAPKIGLKNSALILDAGEGVFPYFGTADSKNMVSVIYEDHE